MRIGFVAVALSLPLAMSSCSLLAPVVNVPGAVRAADRSIEIALCAAVEVDYVSIEKRNLRLGEEWSFLVEDEFDARVSSGEPVLFEIDAPLEKDDELRLFMGRSAPEGWAQVASHKFYISDEHASGWLHPDGTLTDDACGS